MDDQGNLQDPLQTAAEEVTEDNVKFSKNWKPPQGIITGKDLEEIFAKLGSNIKVQDLSQLDKRLNTEETQGK